MADWNEYVKKQDLIDAIYEHEYTNWCDTDEVSTIINDMPSADVVEIVRCEHCLAYDSFKNGIEGFCRKMGKVMCGSDFCSYAERRTDE